MRYIAPILIALMLGPGCGPKESPVGAAPVESGPLEPGEMAVVVRESLHDSGYSLLYDGAEDLGQLPIGSKVLVIAPEDDRIPAPGDWVTVLAGPGVARDYEGRAIGRQVRGVVERWTLARPLPARPPGTPPPTAP